MNGVSRARGLEAAGLVATVGLFAVTVDRYGDSLRDPRFLDGWILAGGLVLLATLELRQRMLTAQAGTLSLWVRVHSFIGWLVIAAFAFHTDWRVPNDVLGWLLWGAFAVLAGSGVLGFLLVRLVPRWLAEGAEPVAFEDIPHVRADLARQARKCAMRAVRDSASSMIAACYANTLQAYFSGPKNLARHLRGASSHLDTLTAELDAIADYVDADGQDQVAELRRLVVQKDDLDRQFALQRLLSGWSFVHLPVGFGLILFSALHILTVYAFSSGAP